MGVVCKDQYTFMIISCSVLLITRSVSDKIVEKVKTHIFVQNSFYCRVGQATDDNMVHAHCVLDN